MPRRGEVVRDRRRSTRNIHVGRVSVFFRGASWYVYYREGGKAKRVRIGPDKAEAERRAAEINAQLAHGLPSAYGFERIAVLELRRLWLEYHEMVRRSSVATVRRYRAATEHLLAFLADEHPRLKADALTPQVAESFVKYLRSQKVGANGHGKARRRRMRDKGIIFVLSTCRSLFNYAARQRHLPPYARNPFAELGIERMRNEDAKPKGIFTPDEEVAFLKACDPWQLRVFATLAFTGMRSGELCHLLIKDVDWGARIIHIRNRSDLGWKTKTRNERRVYLIDGLLDVIRQAVGKRRYGPIFLARKYAEGGAEPPLVGMCVPGLAAELRARAAAAVGRNGHGSPREVTDREAKHLWRDMGASNPRDVRREFMRVTKKMGRPDLTCPKSWRHQLVTAMQEADVDPFARKEIIGHTRLETTAIYTHTREATLGKAMEKVAGLRATTLGAIAAGLSPGSS